MSTASKTKRIKLVFGIAIPVLVLVTTIVMVSMSFAWFSQETTASIQSINLATQKAFVLEFGSSSTTNDNLPYRGQKAIDTAQQLVSPFGAQSEAYKIDAPYFFISAIQISTGGEKVNLRLALDGIEISKETTVLDSYVSGITTGGQHNASYIPLAFTWFFKAHPDVESGGFAEGGALIPTPNHTAEAMKTLALGEGDVWYTPYGRMEMNDSELLINGTTYNRASFNIDDVSTTTEIQGFSAEDGEYFDFYIIFAPEKLFWSHILRGNYTTKVTDLYDLPANPTEGGRAETERREIYGKFFEEGARYSEKYGMYYSDQATYQGSQFKFGAFLEVTSIVEAGADDPSGNP